MDPNALIQLALLVAETLAIGTLLLLFFRMRVRFGLAPLYVTLGGFQHLQTSLAVNVAIELLPGLMISPGSAIMFSAILFTILVVYLREDIAETRSLVYGIVLANLSISAMIGLLSLHVASPLAVVNPMFDPRLLVASLRTFLAGTTILAMDVVLMIILYEFLSRLLKRSAYWRVFLTLVTVLTFDTFAFVTAAFYPIENYRQIIVSGLVGKTFVAAILAVLLATYLRRFDRVEDHARPLGDQVRDFYDLMTYRQRYDVLRERFTRDSMTGLYNRGFFDNILQQEITRAARLGHEASLLMIDLDHFKRINDTCGHTTGDRVIRLLANAIRVCFRNADMPCRFGGEEFVVIMPNTGKAAAQMLAQRLRAAFATTVRTAEPPIEVGPVTMTIGVATFKEDGNDGVTLIEVADRRLYAGKRNGRDCVVADDAPN